MSGTLLKFGFFSCLLFSLFAVAQDTKPADPKPTVPQDNSAFVLSVAAKSPQMVAALHLADATKDGEPTAQLYHKIEDSEFPVEAWLVTQKVKDAEAPIGRRLVHIMVYLTVQMKDKDGKDLEKPLPTVRTSRVVELRISDF